jgi:hypothetical protein
MIEDADMGWVGWLFVVLCMGCILMVGYMPVYLALDNKPTPSLNDPLSQRIYACSTLGNEKVACLNLIDFDSSKKCDTIEGLTNQIN